MAFSLSHHPGSGFAGFPDDLVGKIGKPNRLAVGIGQFESWRGGLVDRLEEFLLAAHDLVEIGARMVSMRRQGNAQQERQRKKQRLRFHGRFLSG